MATASSESLKDLIVPVEAGAHVTGVSFLGAVAAFALGDGAVVLAGEQDAVRFEAHPGGTVLVAAGDGRCIVTGGDDGRVVRILADGTAETLAEAGPAWIDAVALGPDGAVAWSSARKVTVRDGKGWQASLDAGSSARGIAFAPKGFQLAIAHYDGASVWFPRAAAAPKAFPWKGSHIDITWAPDARFIITTMQENALHGWRVADGSHMRMSGYPAKPRSTSWSADGKWLATSGAEAAVIWPFAAKDGPMGKEPRELAVRRARVERVSFHPRAPVLAAGYSDGAVLLARMDDAAELLARPAAAGGAITALAWDGAGLRLAFGTADGAAGILPLPRL